jgi:hypothetical protein
MRPAFFTAAFRAGRSYALLAASTASIAEMSFLARPCLQASYRWGQLTCVGERVTAGEVAGPADVVAQ